MTSPLIAQIANMFDPKGILLAAIEQHEIEHLDFTAAKTCEVLPEFSDQQCGAPALWMGECGVCGTTDNICPAHRNDCEDGNAFCVKCGANTLTMKWRLIP